MDNPISKELSQLNPFEKKVAILSIKYQMDIMSMSMQKVYELISDQDWKDLQQVMKHGGGIIKDVARIITKK